MDDMLAGLQAELAAVQLQESAHKLSERNCIELVKKLQAMGRLDLLTTFNSVPEFVTWDRLEDELVQEIEQSGGRVSLPQVRCWLGGWLGEWVASLGYLGFGLLPGLG